MKQEPERRCPSPQLVGDPVDAVTGACVEVQRELRIPGPIPFRWRRRYDSSKCALHCRLGWGHAHEYEQHLRFDVDGVTFVGPLGTAVSFPYLVRDGATAVAGGLRIVRLAPERYRIAERGQPAREFAVRGSPSILPLTTLIAGEERIEFQYDAQGHLSAVTDPRRWYVSVDCDAAGRILRLTRIGARGTPDRVLIEYQYDAAGNLIAGADAYGNRFAFRYDAANRRIVQTDRAGYSFFYTYDALGRCIETRGEDGLHHVRLEYRPEDGLTFVTRSDGGRWTYRHEAGRLTAILDPYGAARQFVYGDDDVLREELDALGNSTRYAYDAAGALAFLEPPAGGVREPGATRGTGGEHRIASRPIEFDYGDLLVREPIELPTRTRLALLRMPEEIRAAIRTAEGPAAFRDDGLGLLLEERRPEGGVRHWTYDAGGNVRQFRDATGSAYTYERASWNLRTRETEPAGGTIRYEYTATEKLAALTDAGGNRSEYVWDLADRLVEVRRHGRMRETYVRDAAGNLVEKRAADGRLLATFEIGPGNLRTSRYLTVGGTHSFGYDEAGRRVRLATERSETLIERDAQGRVLSEKRDGLGVESTWLQGRVAEALIFGRFRIRFQRTGRRGLTIQDPLGGRHHIRLLGPGLVEREHANGAQEFSQYDAAGRCLLRLLRRPGRGDRPWLRTWRYSGEGDLLEADDSRRGRRRFTFEANHRLTGESAADNGVERYEYDVAGNLVAGPELKGVRLATGNRIAEANGEQFLYNDRDHVAKRAGNGGETAYEYDSNDMLVACTTPAGRLEFDYDAIGRRISRTWTPRTGPAERMQYYWEGDRPLAEVRDGARTRIWLYADALALSPFGFIEYERPDADPASGTRYHVFADQVGAPVRIEDDRGEAVWQAVIRPYGGARVEPSALIQYDLRFPGHVHDPQTGLHYNRFRYYSPELGRFLQSDPAGIVGGLNLYAYTHRPLTRVDVRGLGCDDDPKKPAEGDDKPDDELADPRTLEPTERDIQGGKNKPFDDLPPLTGKTPEEVRAILAEAGFQQTQGERTVQVPGVDADGNPTSTTRTDASGGSEIWMRKNADGSYEAVRVDGHGHNPPPNVPPDQFAGNPPHAHLERIPDDQARRDNATFPFDAKDGSFKKGDNVVPPGSSNADVADNYNNGFTPGVTDHYDDNHDQQPPNNFKANHIPLGSSS